MVAAFRITDGLGSSVDGLRAMRITNEAGEVLFEADDLPCAPEFNQIMWLGFVANGMQPAVMYIDNMKMQEVEPLP